MRSGSRRARRSSQATVGSARARRRAGAQGGRGDRRAAEGRASVSKSSARRKVHSAVDATTAPMKRIWKAWTVPRLAILLVGIAIVAIILDVTTKRLHAWMPNVGIGALSIAVTITVVDKLIKREDQSRIAR